MATVEELEDQIFDTITRLKRVRNNRMGTQFIALYLRLRQISH